MLRENFNKEDVIDFFKKVYGPYNDKMSEGVTFNRMWKKLKDEKFHARIEERLKDYIKVHQSLLDFCVEIETFFSPILLLSYFYGAIYIVFIGVSVIIVSILCLTQFSEEIVFEYSLTNNYLTGKRYLVFALLNKCVIRNVHHQLFESIFNRLRTFIKIILLIVKMLIKKKKYVLDRKISRCHIRDALVCGNAKG